MRRAWLGLLLAGAPLGTVGAQGGSTHVLLITGLSIEPRFAKVFAAAAASIYDAAHERWHVADSSLIYLSEDPAADSKRITGKATKEGVAQAFATLATRAQPGDVVLVFLLGHGTGEMESSAVNLPGPDPLLPEYAAWLAPLARATVIFVNASTGSGDFSRLLAAPDRVIVTATKTGMERNESIFGEFFAKGLSGTEADADKDGRVSVAEAFSYAQEQVTKTYAAASKMLTEHAVLADPSGLAVRIAFGGEAASTDPRITALVRERRLLESQVDSLRRIKATVDSVSYQHALETLLLQIATRTQAINALQAGGKP